MPFYFINLLPTSLLYISILLVHQHIILDDDKANQSLKEAWEQGITKMSWKIDLPGPKRRFWLGT